MNYTEWQASRIRLSISTGEVLPSLEEIVKEEVKSLIGVDSEFKREELIDQLNKKTGIDRDALNAPVQNILRKMVERNELDHVGFGQYMEDEEWK